MDTGLGSILQLKKLKSRNANLLSPGTQKAMEPASFTHCRNTENTSHSTNTDAGKWQRGRLTVSQPSSGGEVGYECCNNQQLHPGVSLTSTIL